MFDNRKYLLAIDGTGQALLAQHIEIGQAIIEGRPGEAEAAARRHMDYVETSFKQGSTDETRGLLAVKRRKVASGR